jgi:hypothetical protein
MPGRTKHIKKHSRRGRRGGSRKITGGSGAADHAIAVYGGIGQQHAGVGNVIAQNAVGDLAQPAALSTLTPAPVMTGGYVDAAINELEVKKELIEQQQDQLEELKAQDGGKGVLTDLAVPAVLLYANQAFGKRRGSKSFKKGRRHSRRRSNRRR